MNPKIEKLTGEIDRFETKITELQARVRDLKKQQTELENAELVAAMRGMKATPAEFEAFLAAKRGKNEGTPAFVPEQADEGAAAALTNPGFQSIQEGTVHEE